MLERVPTRIVHDELLELGEGPTYDPETNTAFWFDIIGKGLYEMPLSGEVIVTRHPMPVMASEIAVVDAATQIVAAEDGLYLRERAGGRLTLHKPLEADRPDTRSNDGGVHPSGALWIGTMGKRAEREAGAIYHYRAGMITQLYANVSIPNAICFSDDGQLAYFADTARNKLMRVACDPATGLPTGEPTELHDQAGGPGALDGALVARDGTIWIACWGGGCLMVLSPGGKVLRRIEVPASQPTCPAFIGEAADRLLVTTAHQGMTPGARADDANAGRTFVLEPGVVGKHPPKVVIG